MTTRAVTFTKQAAKALVRMPRNDAIRIRAKIDQYAADPASLANNVKKLVGSDYTRLRVADYRIIMAEDGTVVDVITIGVRGGVYD
jgi:mRNA interferase RelE/StbE